MSCSGSGSGSRSGSRFGSVAGEGMATQTEIVGLPRRQNTKEAGGRTKEWRKNVQYVSGDNLRYRKGKKRAKGHMASSSGHDCQWHFCNTKQRLAMSTPKPPFIRCVGWLCSFLSMFVVGLLP